MFASWCCSIRVFVQQIESPHPSPADRCGNFQVHVQKFSFPKLGWNHARTKWVSWRSESLNWRWRFRVCRQERSVILNFFHFQNTKEHPEQLTSLSGLAERKWNALKTFLKSTLESVLSAKYFPGACRKPALSLEEQLMIALMRLRLGRLEQELAYLLRDSIICVSRTVMSTSSLCVLALYSNMAHLGDIEWTMYMLQGAYLTAFAILSATKLYCEVPSALTTHLQHLSAYKPHMTIKSLVAVAPNSAFIFISESCYQWPDAWAAYWEWHPRIC